MEGDGAAHMGSTATVGGVPVGINIYEVDSSAYDGSYDVDEAAAREWGKKRHVLYAPGRRNEKVPPDGTVSGVVTSTRLTKTGLGDSALIVVIRELKVDLPGLTRKAVAAAAPAGSGPTSRPAGAATKPAATAVLRSSGEIFNKLPKELMPTPREGWDKFTLPKVQDWLKENTIGSQVEAGVYLSRISVTLNKGAEASRRWQVTVVGTASGKTSVVGGVPVSMSVSGAHGIEFHESFDVDEATARQWQKKQEAVLRERDAPRKANQPVDGTASGTVAFAEVRISGRGRYDLFVEVKEMNLSLAGLTNKADPAGAVKPRP